MELKLARLLFSHSLLPVLIVPSGIETKDMNIFVKNMDVLIVPSGIETKQQKVNPKEEQLY